MLVVVAAVSLAVWVTGGAYAKSPAACGPEDRPETGLQGQIPMADRLSGLARKSADVSVVVLGGE